MVVKFQIPAISLDIKEDIIGSRFGPTAVLKIELFQINSRKNYTLKKTALSYLV